MKDIHGTYKHGVCYIKVRQWVDLTQTNGSFFKLKVALLPKQNRIKHNFSLTQANDVNKYV